MSTMQSKVAEVPGSRVRFLITDEIRGRPHVCTGGGPTLGDSRWMAVFMKYEIFIYSYQDKRRDKV